LGLLLIALIGCAWLTGSTFAQNGLTVEISTENEVYRVGQPVGITYTVVNDTGQTINIKRADCTPTFSVVVYDLDDNLVWNSEDCPICCCTCCQCPIRIIQRDILPGETVFENDTTWRQVQTVRRETCGCVTQPVLPGFYYLIGQVLDAMSDPILVEIR
jgi:hypothetical protein